MKRQNKIDDFRVMYADTTLDHELLTPDEERRLVVEKCQLQGKPEQSQADEQRLRWIINHLVENNMRLVSSVVKAFHATDLHKTEWEDLMQDGAIGLHKGIVKFDADRRTDDGKPLKLSTYATWWIRQGVERSIHDKGRTIRIPVHFGSNEMRKVKRASEVYIAENGQRATIEELAKITGFTENKVKEALIWVGDCQSLDAPCGDDDTFGNMLSDENGLEPIAISEDSQAKEMVLKIVRERLNVRECQIVTMRFGLDDTKPHTLEEVGQKFGLTRERIRQIENVAIKRLRHPKNSRALRSLVIA